MAYRKDITNLSELLWKCMAQPDPMLSMLEWLGAQLMEAEVSSKLSAEKNERADERSGYRCGYRPRRLDTRMGTMYLMVPKVRQGGYIPFFITERRRSEAALIQVVQEAFIQGVSTRKIDRLAIEPVAEESEGSYSVVFDSLKERGLSMHKLIISDAHAGLVSAIRSSFPGSSWQRCKVHFMRNILVYVPQKIKEAFAAELKEIWLAPEEKAARTRAEGIIEKYGIRFPKATGCLEKGLEDSLTFYAFPELDRRKISSTNMIERLNREIRRRTGVVGIFPCEDSYIRLVTAYLMEYAEDWSVSRAYISERSLRPILDKAA